MLEVAADVPGAEGRRSGLLEDDCHDVVPDVALTEELLAVVWGEGEERRDMEHHLHVSVLVVDAIQPRGVRWMEGSDGGEFSARLGIDTFTLNCLT